MGKNLREIDMDIFNSKSYAECEIPSAGAKCSARGLAKLASAMANQGRYKNLTLLSKGGHAAMHEGIESRRMSLLNTSFTQSGLAYFEGRSTFDDPMEKGLVEGREGFLLDGFWRLNIPMAPKIEDWLFFCAYIFKLA